jgi:hypothetical protein
MDMTYMGTRTIEGIVRQVRQQSENFNTGIREPEQVEAREYLLLRRVEEGLAMKFFYNEDNIIEVEFYEDNLCTFTVLFTDSAADKAVSHLVNLINSRSK